MACLQRARKYFYFDLFDDLLSLLHALHTLFLCPFHSTPARAQQRAILEENWEDSIGSDTLNVSTETESSGEALNVSTERKLPVALTCSM